MSLGRQRLSQAAVFSADGRDQQRKQLVKDFIHAGPERLASGPFDSVALSSYLAAVNEVQWGHRPMLIHHYGLMGFPRSKGLPQQQLKSQPDSNHGAPQPSAS